MAYAGQTICNSISGETITFVKTAADTDGELLEIDMTLAAVVVVPPGVTHRFRNGGDEEARVRVQVRPALKMEELFESTVALAEEGKTNRKGMPRPVHLALFVGEYEREVRAPFPPAPVVNALMAPLAWYGRRRGHAERYAPAPLRPVVSYS
jgi:hypothetical protein